MNKQALRFFLKRAFLTRMTLAFCATLLVLGVRLDSIPGAAAQGQPAAQAQVYLPLVFKPDSPSTPDPTPPPTNVAAGLFLEKAVRTHSSAATIDVRGGMHFAYSAYVGYGDPSPAYYAYCANQSAGACGSPAGWSIATIADRVDEVQLALTPAGQPRLLMSTSERHFLYAECDASCGNPAQWAVYDVVATEYIDVNQWDNPQHYFALDSQGRPRFVFFDDSGLNHAYYVYCDQRCAAGDSGWFGTEISLVDEEYHDEEFRYPALAFTGQDQPRILVQIHTPFGDDGLYYLACDAACDDPASWGRARIADVQAGWDLELNGQDQPRAVLHAAPATPGQPLSYAWCDGDCLQPESWQSRTLSVEQGDGEDPDLALDAQGNPRVAYHAGGGAGLAYLWCNAECGSAGGQWKRAIVEPSSAMEDDMEVPVPFDCDQAGWVGGYRPSLALDAQGNPRVAYDALFLARCYYTKPGDPTRYTRIEALSRAARWTFIQQP